MRNQLIPYETTRGRIRHSKDILNAMTRLLFDWSILTSHHEQLNFDRWLCVCCLDINSTYLGVVPLCKSSIKTRILFSTSLWFTLYIFGWNKNIHFWILNYHLKKQNENRTFYRQSSMVSIHLFTPRLLVSLRPSSQTFIIYYSNTRILG